MIAFLVYETGEFDGKERGMLAGSKRVSTMVDVVSFSRSQER